MNSLDTAIYILKVGAWIAAFGFGGFIAFLLMQALLTPSSPRPKVQPSVPVPRVPDDPILKSNVPEDVRTRVLRAYELGLPALIGSIASQIWCWPVWLRQSYGARIFEVFGDVKAEEHPSRTVEFSLGSSRFTFLTITTGESSDSEWTWRRDPSCGHAPTRGQSPFCRSGRRRTIEDEQLGSKTRDPRCAITRPCQPSFATTLKRPSSFLARSPQTLLSGTGAAEIGSFEAWTTFSTG